MSVLITGATGFIGRAVARHLLATGRSVIALARGRDGATAVDRVLAALGEPPANGVLDVIDGDLALPDCALAPAPWRRLRTRVETVIHCAGDTTFAPDAIGPYLAGHLEGPVRLLEGLAGGRLARWAHLSTAFVCGRRTGRVLEREGDVGQAFHNVYERVKLESEAMLRAAGRRLGVDVRVVRPSIVVGEAPTTAGGTPSNLLLDFIRLLAALAQLPGGSWRRLRVAAAPRARFNIVPVEYVATAVTALADSHPGAGETFHLVVSEAPTQAAMLRMITERLSLHGVSLVDADDEPLDDPSPFERTVARMLEPYHAYLTQDVQFDDANARRLLTARGIERPTLSAGFVHRLVDLALVTEGARCSTASPAAR